MSADNTKSVNQSTEPANGSDNLVAEKVRQAASLLVEFDIPLWIVQFARESIEHSQPVGNLAVGTSVTWPAAFVITQHGESTAIVATLDMDNVRGVGAYDTIVGYVHDIAPPLLELLERVDPARIGLSFSESDEGADNITHGMFLLLSRILAGTRFANRLVSAEPVLTALRARKTPEEVRRIRNSIELTMPLFAEIEERLALGMTERELFDLVHASMASSGVTAAWDPGYDPTVNFGPDSSFGHAGPGNIRLEPGMLVHVDLGVKSMGYCSDLQRTWYVLREEETHAPDEVQSAFETLCRALQTGFEALAPGVPGYQVDAVARKVLTDAGYEEPSFSLGHQLGQSTHDAGALLGPRWPRYGNRPELLVEQGNVFTLEYGLHTSAGTIGLEEDVLVSAKGAEYLSRPQTELMCLRR